MAPEFGLAEHVLSDALHEQISNLPILKNRTVITDHCRQKSPERFSLWAELFELSAIPAIELDPTDSFCCWNRQLLQISPSGCSWGSPVPPPSRNNLQNFYIASLHIGHFFTGYLCPEPSAFGKWFFHPAPYSTFVQLWGFLWLFFNLSQTFFAPKFWGRSQEGWMAVVRGVKIRLFSLTHPCHVPPPPPPLGREFLF